MSKKNILTAGGVILSFVIAIGGWILTSHLIGINSDRLMSETLSIATNTLTVTQIDFSEAPNADDNDTPITRPGLTENEIVSILRNWGADGQETPHEPTREQLNMEQAIEAGREWLSFVDGFNISPDGLLRFTNVRAYLFQNLPLGQGRQFLPPAYSYWTVVFANESMNVSLGINAVTGQVWETEISVFRDDIGINVFDITSVLSEFVLVLGISQNGQIIFEDAEDTTVQIFVSEIHAGGTARESEILSASYSVADGNANATVIAVVWQFEDGERILRNLRIHLTDQK